MNQAKNIPHTSGKWNMFLDDIRVPAYVDPTKNVQWVLCRNLYDAVSMCARFGMPGFISFDYDLGPNEDSMMFLRWLANDFFIEGKHNIPRYQIHSANPCGALNIDSFMKSWKKSIQPA